MIVALAGGPVQHRLAIGQELSRSLSGVHLELDSLHRLLFPKGILTRSDEQEEFCLDVLLRVAGWHTDRRAERPVLLAYPADQLLNEAALCRLAERLDREVRLVRYAGSASQAVRGRTRPGAAPERAIVVDERRPPAEEATFVLGRLARTASAGPAPAGTAGAR
ncbi:hypothetical protein [Kitasatospora sp. NPDC059327]|uniref:hypothetical protein n=1 Tax=Kitasatospora sp. NPDC059327 TaxID=3346803 RepID=UPI003678ED2F